MACSLKNSQNVFINLYFCIHYAYFLSLNDNIADRKKSDGTPSLTFVENGFLGLSLHL